jgi:hypothetical protein
MNWVAPSCYHTVCESIPPKNGGDCDRLVVSHMRLVMVDDQGKISLRSPMVCGTITAAAMTPDIVANAIIAALSAGAVQGATDTAKSAIADDQTGGGDPSL